MEEMRKITVRVPAEMFNRLKASTGETNSGVLKLALDRLVRDAEARQPGSDRPK
jgi:hypothetical protein